MCNLYAMMRSRAEVATAAEAMRDRNNNQPPSPGIFPDYPGPVVLRVTMVSARCATCVGACRPRQGTWRKKPRSGATS